MIHSPLAQRHNLRRRARAPDTEPRNRASVLLVEDHVALRKGLELLLQVSDINLAGVASTSDEGCRLYAIRRPDVAVVDITLGAASGLPAVRRILESDPDAGVVVFVGLGDRDAIETSASCGARGFVLKAGGSDELVAAIKAVANGGVYVDSAVSVLLAGEGPPDLLTLREREILQLLARGFSGERIAATIFLSPQTVRTHIRNAMRRLGARTRVHAVVLALNLGQISQERPAAD
jgi:DNA-binding NarL/FixJ family response regulator